MHYLILSLTLCLISFKAPAQWPSEVRKIMEASTVRATYLSNPAVATLWGGFRRYRFFTQNQGRVIPFQSTHFKSGQYPLYFSQLPQKAKLFVFMPGIYGQPARGLTPQFVDFLEKIPGHVLVVPNLLGPGYVEAYPLYKEDPIAFEVNVMEEALDFAIKELGDRVQGVEVIAESLGTAVGGAWTAHDRLHRQRITGVTLLWPPLNLARAMKNFDAIINEYRPWNEKCGTMQKLFTLTQNFVFQDFPGPLTLEDEGCLGALVLVDGFVKSTKESWRAYVRASQAPGPEPEGFEEYFRRYRPELWTLLEQQDQRLRLTHWMKIIRQDRKFPVRIMTSENDFLNRGLSWAEFMQEHQLGDKEVIILPWGGHSGPVSIPEFLDVLKATF